MGAAATGLGLATQVNAETQGTAQTQGTGVASPASGPSPAALTRTLPRTGEQLTALGLGTFLTFDLKPGARRDGLRQVFERYVAAGGPVVDTSPLYGSAEGSVGQFMGEYAGSDGMFLANKVWATGEYLGHESHAEDSLRQSRLRTWRDTINMMQCHSITNAPVIIPLMKAWKREGLIRHVGVTHHESAAQDQLTTIVERDDVDFVQTNYSIFNRTAERRLLPAAADKGMGVLIKSAAREGAPDEVGRRTAAAGLRARVRRHQLGAILPEVGHGASFRHDRTVRHIESRPHGRQCPGHERSAARPAYARPHGRAYGDNSRLWLHQHHALVSRQGDLVPRPGPGGTS